MGGLANALYLAGQMRFWRGDAEGAIAELERAADHARESGDRTLEAEILRSVLTAARSGSMPAEAMVKLAAEVMRRVPGSRRLEMGGLATRAEVSAMQGDFEAARALLRQAMTLEEEVGLKTMATTAPRSSCLPATGREAERHARQDLQSPRADWRLGSPLQHGAAAGDALYDQGRIEEAEPSVELGSSKVMDEDMDAQIGSLHQSEAGRSSRGRSDGRRAGPRGSGLSQRAPTLPQCAGVGVRGSRRGAAPGGTSEEATAVLQRRSSVRTEGQPRQSAPTRTALAALTAQPPATA